MHQNQLFFDYQSTTPCSARAIEAMAPYWDQMWGNPSNRQNRQGLEASAALELAREEFGLILNVSPSEIVFTSGATEANNLALLGHARAKASHSGGSGHIITLSTEHHSVLDPLRQLEKEGFKLTEIKPKYDGLVCLDELENAFNEDTILVSIMLANNEIGVLQPIREIGNLCKERGVIFHTDAVQGFGKIPLKLDLLAVDMLSISAHKIYGPKGIGALIVKENVPIQPLQWGGGQEKGMRSGTIPVPLAVGFLEAAKDSIDSLEIRYKKYQSLQCQFLDGLQTMIPEVIINGSLIHRLPNNINFTIPGVNGNRLHRELRPFISCSSGSACSNGSPSHVLLSLGRSTHEAAASLRLSLGCETNKDDIEKALILIGNVVKRLRS